jgi:hypothetical protein
MKLYCWGGPLDGQQHFVGLSAEWILSVHQQGLTHQIIMSPFPDERVHGYALVGYYAVRTDHKGFGYLRWTPIAKCVEAKGGQPDG